MIVFQSSVASGKYLISPLVETLNYGWLTALVPIRSGTGTARVLRLTQLFRNTLAAVQDAGAEGLQWTAHRAKPRSTTAVAR